MDRHAYIRKLARLNRHKESIRQDIYNWAIANGFGDCKPRDLMMKAPGDLVFAYRGSERAAHEHILSGISLGFVYVVGNETRITTGRGRNIVEHSAEHYCQ